MIFHNYKLKLKKKKIMESLKILDEGVCPGVDSLGQDLTIKSLGMSYRSR